MSIQKSISHTLVFGQVLGLMPISGVLSIRCNRFAIQMEIVPVLLLLSNNLPSAAAFSLVCLLDDQVQQVFARQYHYPGNLLHSHHHSFLSWEEGGPA